MKYLEKMDEHILEHFWTAPNVITLLRIVLIVPIVVTLCLKDPGGNLVAFLLIVLAYFTDFLDGFVARKTGAVSKAGMMLDPVSDKLLSAALSLTLLILGKFPLYYFILIVGRDAVISVGALYAMKKEHMITLPLTLGKINTLILGIVLGLYPLDIYLRESATTIFPAGFGPYIAALVKYGTYVSAALCLVSGVVYTVTFVRKLWFDKPAES